MKYGRKGKIVKIIGALAGTLTVAVNMLAPFQALRALPERIYEGAAEGADWRTTLPSPLGIYEGTASEADEAGATLSETLGEKSGEREYTVTLFGIPVKRLSVVTVYGETVMPGGETIGISIYSDGVMVAGTGDIDTLSGAYSPAERAGIEPGDIIMAVEGERIATTDELMRAFSAGGAKTLSIVRGDAMKELVLLPAVELSSGKSRLGMWVRDSTAGIGTLSFYCMASERLAALGHSVTDPDTGTIVPVRSGEVASARVMGVSQGENGTPGEVRGAFGALSERHGSIDRNTELGIYGKMYRELANPLYPNGVEIASPDELQEGEATLLSAVSGEMREYTCRIIKLFRQDEANAKSMVVEITDPALLAETGGIVQGMSGSPIMQKGKLAGAVTHVFISDPTRGYGVYALWMYENADLS